MAQIRTFICFELPEPILAQLRDYQEALKTYGPTVKWTRPGGIHLTLKFLGDVEEEKIDEIAGVLKEVSKEFEPIPIHVASSGVFPSYRKPRVFWVGVDEPSGTLERLQQRIEEELEKIGYEKESRRFHPHLTIGRLKRLTDLTRLVSKLKTDQIDMGSFTANEIVIMKSVLKQTGAEYTPLRKIEL